MTTSETPALASVIVVANDGWWSEAATSLFADNGIAVVLDPTGARIAEERLPISDAAIVDLGLSASAPRDVFAAWRGRSRGALLAVAATRTVDEAVVLAAYAAGVDHVARMDVSPRQLIARLRSLWRRSGLAVVSAGVTPVEPTSVQLDPFAHVALINGEKVELTPAEFDFLQLLIDRSGGVVHRSTLRPALRMSNNAIDFLVRRLRQKLELVDGSRRIVAVRGVGFRFEASPPVEIEAAATTAVEPLIGGATA